MYLAVNMFISDVNLDITATVGVDMLLEAATSENVRNL